MREENIHTETRETGKYRLPFFIIAVLLISSSVSAYVGPGAGFGIVTSFLVFLNAILVSLLSALIWPVTYVLRLLKRRRRQYRKIADRVVILGLDGLSPRIASELMDSGEMPNLKKLRDMGTFTEMKTTCPGISPVAWSSFQTGTNPGKHGIFDFLAPDRKRYLPVLSSVKTGTSESTRSLGPFKRKVSRTYIKGLRKSRPFWKLLKRYGIRSTVLRVPITYPPESLDGHLLSGMCVPDLRGTQGSYTLFSPEEPDAFTGGLWRKLQEKRKGVWKASIPGPEMENGNCSLVDIELHLTGDQGLLKACDKQLKLQPGVLSDWFSMTFRVGRSKVKGISRFCLSRDSRGNPVLYSTAVHVDPFSPAVPISYPVHYSRYLAGLYGPFATLGLAEDTWALNNGAITEETFLSQAWSIFDERKDMFFDALKRTPKGLVVCVFDTSDRIQHMFWSRGTGEGTPVREMYRRMDDLVGDTLKKMKKKDMLVVMSDHGFTSFHTCVDFNRWLVENGYMVLEEGVENVQTGFKGVDWSRTRAWSMGLAGIMLNLKDREGKGIVEPGEEARELLNEISNKLLQLKDENGRKVISAVYPAEEVYSGPYSGHGPDLVVGTAPGYRAGWSCVTGGVGPKTVYPNGRHWNGDHCHDHAKVPGTLAADRELQSEGAGIIDVAPTALRALGIKAPGYMEGRSLLKEGREE